MTFPAQAPAEAQVLELPKDVTRPTELYLVYPSSWVTADSNDNVINPKIYDSNNFENGAWIDSTVTVNGVSYTIIGTELGVDSFTIAFS
jgi:hypothetical protein